MIRFTIIGEPASKANSRKIVMKGKRPGIIKSDKAREYERSALLQIPTEAKQMLQGKVRVSIVIYYANERSDLDASVILDVLQAKLGHNVRTKERVVIRKGVYLNDRQVREMHFYHEIDRKNPRAEICVEPLDAELDLAFAKERHA